MNEKLARRERTPLDSDLIKLYSGRFLALAADIPLLGRRVAPMGSAICRSPQCGAAVTVDIDVVDGRIARFSQDVKACALGQAAAAVVGASAIGRSRGEISQARDELAAMLTEDSDAPHAPFGDLAVLRPAAAYRNRHASILLSLDATLAALDTIELKAQAD